MTSRNVIKDYDQFQIPRYLALREVVNKKRKTTFELHFGFTNQMSKTLTVDNKGLELLRAFLQPIDLKTAAFQLNLPISEVKEFCTSMLVAGFLVKVSKIAEKLKRYDRHLLFYSLDGSDSLEVQQRISRSTVALIGMGGIGNWTSSGLIGSGFKELRIVDFDKVEITNLTRQILFDEKDVGKLKTKVARMRLAPKNKQTKVVSFHQIIDGVQSLKSCLTGVDFVFLSADRPAQIHDWVDEICLKMKIPYLNIGYRDGVGVVGPMTVHGRTSCYQCFKPKTNSAKKSGNQFAKLIQEFENRYQAPSFGPLNALVSAIGVLEATKYLGGFGEIISLGVEIMVNPLDLSFEFTKYRHDKKCWNCGYVRSHGNDT